MSYEPPKQLQPGGCAEIFVITRVVFSVILPVLAVLLGVLVLLFVFFALVAVNPPLALIPLGLGALALAAFALYERRGGSGGGPPPPGGRPR